MGVDDLMAARNMVMAAMKTTELKRIDYQTFNSLQKVGDTAMEARYNTLLQRVGSTVSFDPDLVNIPLCFFLSSWNWTPKIKTPFTTLPFTNHFDVCNFHTKFNIKHETFFYLNIFRWRCSLTFYCSPSTLGRPTKASAGTDYWTRLLGQFKVPLR